MDLKNLLIGAILIVGLAHAIPSSLDEETLVESLDNRGRQPKINIEIDPNDFENNEIDGGSSKKEKVKVVDVKEEESNDWFSYIIKFFGYKSFGDLVKNVDIFSLPQAIQNATRTYKEEIGLGQCYMEFTTFAVFSQEDSVFYNYSVLRTKRDASEHPMYAPEELVEEGRATDNGQANMINNLAQSLISMLQRSPATAKYGTTIKQLLPMVMDVIGNDNPQQAMIQFATKNLLPLISGLASGGGSSTKEKISYQKPSPSFGQNSVQSPSSSSSSLGSSAITPLLNLASQFLLGGGNRKPSPSKRPPVPVKKTQVITKAQEKVDKKTSFTQTILDFIRPLFISIVGSAPGDNGVQTLRDVSRLSTLSRVDDELLDQVKSPFFCAKNYMINKAWSLTENGVDYVVGYIDTAQQARMFRMLVPDNDQLF